MSLIRKDIHHRSNTGSPDGYTCYRVHIDEYIDWNIDIHDVCSNYWFSESDHFLEDWWFSEIEAWL